MAAMTSLLPDRTVDGEEATPGLISLTDSDDILDALSSNTARDIFATVHEEPTTASEIADTVGTSLQNANYHLSKLHDAGLIDVVDTWYSAKGREMDVYAPANQPLIMFAGESQSEDQLRKLTTT